MSMIYTLFQINSHRVVVFCVRIVRMQRKNVLGQAKRVVFRLLEKTDAELLSYLTIAHKKTNSAELVLYIV